MNGKLSRACLAEIRERVARRKNIRAAAALDAKRLVQHVDALEAALIDLADTLFDGPHFEAMFAASEASKVALDSVDAGDIRRAYQIGRSCSIVADALSVCASCRSPEHRLYQCPRFARTEKQEAVQ
jgi:hypothetical protein